ncbi:MAG: hypothetical protein M3Z31_02115 [Pseudomonadota bacterium]|nr:hypothetical protein [Pseudomonadota bacterium]
MMSLRDLLGRLHDSDRSVLDEIASFLEGHPANPENHSYYDLPGGS